MAFGLHFFCGGGYYGCVSLNIFSASFSWFSFALRRCNFRFWDCVIPAGHHQGMKYFGSTVLMVAVSSFLVVLADSPKTLGTSLSFCMMTSVVPILMMSFFVVLSVAAGICPPCRIGRPWRPSSPAILLGLCLVTELSGAQSVLYWWCQPVEYRCLGCPQVGYCGFPNEYGGMPHI
jgi:hypothetical protein